MNNQLIGRTLAETINKMFDYLPVITLTGPRQSGKTTLCRELFPELPYANLEDISVLNEIQTDTKSFLNKYPSGLILDEAQNFPEIFSHLQVAVDEDHHSGRAQRHFIVTGSNNFSLMERITQSLAGRTAVVSLLPLSTQEIMTYSPHATVSQMILNGGYPAVWTSGTAARQILLSNYYTTYVERDIRRLINVKHLQAFQTFIRLCAGRIGQEFNMSALSNEVGVSINTIKSWLSVLSASFVVYLLHPYYANIGKRLTKTPKLYFYDTALAAFLLGINSEEQMDYHPLRGNLFENLVVNDFVKHGTNLAREERLFFYRDKSQREIDIIRLQPMEQIEAYEIKSSMTFQPSFFDNLKYLKSLFGDRLLKTAVIYDGDQQNLQADNGFFNFRQLGNQLKD